METLIAAILVATLAYFGIKVKLDEKRDQQQKHEQIEKQEKQEKK